MLIELNEALIVFFFTTWLQSHIDGKQWENQATNSPRLVNCFKGECEWKRKGTSSSISKSNICYHQPEIAIWQNENFFPGRAKIPIYSYREILQINWVCCACAAKTLSRLHNKITEVCRWLEILWKTYILLPWIKIPGHEVIMYVW